MCLVSRRLKEKEPREELRVGAPLSLSGMFIGMTSRSYYMDGLLYGQRVWDGHPSNTPQLVVRLIGRCKQCYTLACWR